MAIAGCQGRPDGALCSTPNRSDAKLNSEDGQSYCDACLRAHRLHKRSGGRGADTTTTTSGGESTNHDDDQSPESAPAPSDVIFSPLLAYVVHAKISGGTNDMTKNAVLSRFPSEQIKTAKCELWKAPIVDIVGSFQNRRGSEVRSLDEANVLDIIGAIDKLDRADRIPAIAILSKDLGLIPRAHPEEVLPISFGDRMNRTEHRITDLTDLIERVVAETADLRTEFHLMRSTASERSTGSNFSRSDSSERKRKKKKKDKKVSSAPAMPGAATLNALPGAPNLCNALPQQSSSDVEPGDGDDGDEEDEDDNQEPYTKVDYSKRRNSRKTYVTGSGGAGLNSFSGAEPNRHIFVGGVSGNATEEDVKNWVTDKIGAEVRHFEKLPPSAKRPPSSDSQSFWITVPLKDSEAIMKSESWPDGIRLRRFFPRTPTKTTK